MSPTWWRRSPRWWAITGASFGGNQGGEPALKRPFDLIVACLGLVVLSPVLAGIAAAIRLDSPGPVLYRAQRAGRFGKPFTMLKFRTMQDRREAHGTKITTHADRRVTRVGRLLRPTRLDELPQLWHVLTGAMSLVGPRPEDPHYLGYYSDRHWAVLSARPGITSLTSLLYRDEERLLVGDDWERVYIDEVMPAKLDIDLAYVERRSFGLDLKILAATALALLRLERLVPLGESSSSPYYGARPSSPYHGAPQSPRPPSPLSRKRARGGLLPMP